MIWQSPPNVYGLILCNGATPASFEWCLEFTWAGICMMGHLQVVESKSYIFWTWIVSPQNRAILTPALQKPDSSTSLIWAWPSKFLPMFQASFDFIFGWVVYFCLMWQFIKWTWKDSEIGLGSVVLARALNFNGRRLIAHSACISPKMTVIANASDPAFQRHL